MHDVDLIINEDSDGGDAFSADVRNVEIHSKDSMYNKVINFLFISRWAGRLKIRSVTNSIQPVRVVRADKGNKLPKITSLYCAHVFLR